MRLIHHAKSHKLLTNNRIGKIEAKRDRIAAWEKRLEAERTKSGLWGDLIRRDGDAASLPGDLLAEEKAVREEVLYRVRYRGYRERELRQVEKLKDIERVALPADLDYLAIPGLRRESAQKLQQFRPVNLGQASRISGVNPADVSLLLVLLESRRRGRPAGP
jgi:tRNA uridine 5-carboxymethylaminomethyl modification enzyme